MLRLLGRRYCSLIAVLFCDVLLNQAIALDIIASVDAGANKTVNAASLQNAATTGTIISYQWTQVGGPPGGILQFGTPATEDTTIQANLEGVYTARLTIVALPLSVIFDEMTFIWDVTPPVIDPMPDLQVEGNANGGGIVSYAEAVTSDANPVSVSYSSPAGSLFPLGETIVNVTATDAAGNSASTTFKVTVIDTLPPIINSGPFITPAIAHAGHELQFACVVTDARPLSYNWNFGDGASDTAAAPRHKYTVPGDYSVTVVITDGGGLNTQANIVIPVLEGAPAIPDGGGGTGEPGSGGDGGTLPRMPLAVSRLSGSANYSTQGNDKYSVSGTITDVPKTFDPAGATIVLNLGGAIAAFTLDAKGKAKTASGALSLKLKYGKNPATKAKEFLGGAVPYKAAIKGNFAPQWRDEGLDPANSTPKGTTSFLTELQLNGITYSSTTSTFLANKAGKGARFKL